MKTFKRIFSYTKSFRLLILLSIISSIFYVVLNSMSIWLIGTMLGNVMTDNSLIVVNPNNLNEYLNYLVQNLIGSGSQIEQLKSLCILLAIIFVVKNILFYLSNLIMAYVQNNVITTIRIKLFKHISTLSLSFFNNTKISDLSSILIRDIGGMRVAFSQSLQKLIVEPISIISFIFLLLVINIKFAIFVITIIPLSGFFSYKVGQSIRRKSKRTSIQSAGILNIIKETLTNIKIVKIFNLEKLENKKFIKENIKYFDLIFKQSKLAHLLTPINETIGLLVGILLIWFGGTSVLQDQTMKSDDFIKFILLLFAMLQPIRKLSNINVLFQNGIAAAERVFSIFDNYQKIKEENNAIKINQFKSNIVFENVSFKYDNDNQENILNRISVNINKGQTIAIVGESGAGKSTFSELIPRLYDVTEGQLLIDGININKYTLNSLRNLIGVVTQNSILFNDTIKSNISYGNDNVLDSQVLDAIKSANLENLINKLSDGINTIIGENGVKLSGGEKQRLSIARAIIKNPEILILDEATASLDSDSEKKVHKAINNLIKDRTVIIIAHRLSTIINADNILVFMKGNIIEQGTHRELLKHSTVYKNLYELQMGKK
jgi:ATP-binding cassette, subfamily B, bacterial MsbA